MIRHMHVNVRGMLKRTDKELKKLAPMFNVDGQSLSNSKQVRAFLEEALAEGWECLPAGECDNFDPKRGCKGHAK